MKFITFSNLKIALLLAVYSIMLVYSSDAIGCTNYMFLFVGTLLVLAPVRSYFDKYFLFLTLFSISYSAFLYFNVPTMGLKNILGLLLCPPFFYCFGRFIEDVFRNTILMQFFLIITIISSSAFFYYNIYLDYEAIGLVNPLRKLIIDDTVDKHATYYGLLASIGLSGISIGLYKKCFKKNLLEIFLITLGVCSLLSVMHLVNRTGLVLLFVSFLLLFVFWTKRSKSKILIGAAIVIGILAVIVYLSDFISDDYIGAYSDRSESVEGAGNRSWRWVVGLENLFLYPFGWSDITGYQKLYVHNLWLDVSRMTGVIPFLFLVRYSYFTIKDCLALFRQDEYEDNIIFIILFIIFTLSSFMEPVIDGFALYFLLYCMIGGLQRQKVINNNKLNKCIY